MVAASLGAKKVVLTDLPEALPTRQVQANRSVWQRHCTSVECYQLDWWDVMKFVSSTSIPDPLSFVDPETSLVLVADCVWTMELLPPLLATIQALMNRLMNVTFLIAYQKRGATTHDAFMVGSKQLFCTTVAEEHSGTRRTWRQLDSGSINPVLFLFEGKQLKIGD